ncbi:MAG: TIGR01777 family oxidoreductase [Candidatus Aminicenantales bacterium]
MMPKVLITGGTGFIGRTLSRRLLEAGYEVLCLTRNPLLVSQKPDSGLRYVLWNGRTGEAWADEAEGARAIVNLAGENIGAGRWTKKRRERILRSRVDAGRAVVEAVERTRSKPGVVIQASAVGYYGTSLEAVFDESSPPGEGFLADVCREWESSTREVRPLGIRHVVVRSGIVLEKHGGALPRLAGPFRFFLGGPVGPGTQWISWVHLEDEVRILQFLIEHPECQGPFNLTAPHPVRNREFSAALGKALGRPSRLPVPGWGLVLIFGRMARETLLGGQRVHPQRILEAGYRFRYPEVRSALRAIFRK